MISASNGRRLAAYALVIAITFFIATTVGALGQAPGLVRGGAGVVSIWVIAISGSYLLGWPARLIVLWSIPVIAFSAAAVVAPEPLSTVLLIIASMCVVAMLLVPSAGSTSMRLVSKLVLPARDREFAATLKGLEAAVGDAFDGYRTNRLEGVDVAAVAAAARLRTTELAPPSEEWANAQERLAAYLARLDYVAGNPESATDADFAQLPIEWHEYQAAFAKAGKGWLMVGRMAFPER